MEKQKISYSERLKLIQKKRKEIENNKATIIKSKLDIIAKTLEENKDLIETADKLGFSYEQTVLKRYDYLDFHYYDIERVVLTTNRSMRCDTDYQISYTFKDNLINFEIIDTSERYQNTTVMLDFLTNVVNCLPLIISKLKTKVEKELDRLESKLDF